MSYLRYLTLGLSAAGIVLTQLTNVLPEGRIKNYATIASAFLAGLPITVFKPSAKVGLFDLTPTVKVPKK